MRVFLRTFGCRANHYDTEALRERISAEGHEIVAAPHDADVAIFNSCAVTSEAEADLRQGVRGMARANPGVRSIVMGCAAALDRGVIRSLPTVTHVVPGADLSALSEALALRTPPVSIATRSQTTVRAVLRIQDGCDEHCTFCATTLARGSSRSRPTDELIAEARELAAHHPEIVLTGIHIGSWGVERGESLGTLLQRLIDDVPDARFRLSSLEATEVDDTLASLLRGESGRLVPYLHAPLQSGSDRVLRRMGRHWYTGGAYAACIRALVEDRKIFGLGADVIAGFPGETEDDHAATLALVEGLPFTYLHVFPFSSRPATAAARLSQRVPPHVIDRRTSELRALGAQKAAAYRARRAGDLADVIVTSGGPRPTGMTEDFLTVRVQPGKARGTRFRARLVSDDAQLMAIPEPASPRSGRYLWGS